MLAIPTENLVRTPPRVVRRGSLLQAHDSPPQAAEREPARPRQPLGETVPLPSLASLAAMNYQRLPVPSKFQPTVFFRTA